MFAYQAGLKARIPLLPFTQLQVRYTKIEPYTYTHNRITTPWNGDLAMEEAYINHNVSIGYYTPPNSDELLARFEMMPSPGANFHLQYQLIRHGADWGSQAVDGSSLHSELDPSGRSEKPVLRKYFLHDGAYQWFHILKVGGTHNFSNIPIKLFGDIGIVYSSFTDIDGEPNSGESFDYKVIDTIEYPKQLSFIVTLGIKISPN
jgi:hypothetical protein